PVEAAIRSRRPVGARAGRSATLRGFCDCFRWRCRGPRRESDQSYGVDGNSRDRPATCTYLRGAERPESIALTLPVEQFIKREMAVIESAPGPTGRRPHAFRELGRSKPGRCYEPNPSNHPIAA